jgi:hypothetical protein
LGEEKKGEEGIVYSFVLYDKRPLKMDGKIELI